MRILRLLLINRKRLSGYTKIDIDMSDERHLVLGDNGSGKTTILSEMSALPPDPKDYGADGQKSIWFELDDGRVVEFTSYPNQKKHHGVYINDDKENNLNISGTVTEQKELAKKYTGITKEFFELLVLGTEQFTETKPPYRRELFNKINPTNFDYALKVYQKLRDGYKYNQAIIKHLTKQLSILEARKVNDDEIEAMDSRLRTIDDELAVWLDLKLKNLKKPDSLRNEITRIVAEYRSHVNRLSKRFDKLEDHLDYPTLVREAIAANASEIKVLRDQIGQLSVTLDSKKKSIHFDGAKRQSAILEINRLVQEIEAHSQYTYYDYLNTVELNTSSHYEQFFARVVQAAINLPARYDEVTFSDIDYTAKLENLQKDRENTQLTILELNKAIDHYEKHIKSDKVTCPSCAYEFIPFLKIMDIDDIKNCLADSEKILKEILIEEENVKATHAAIIQDRANYKHFLDILHSEPIVAQWWLDTRDQKTIDYTKFYKLNESINIELERRALIVKKEKIEHELAIHKEYDEGRELAIKDEINLLNEQLNEMHTRLVDLTVRGNTFTNYLRDLTRRINDIEELTTALNKIYELAGELNTSVTNEFIEVHVGELTKRRAELYQATETARNNLKDRLVAKTEIEQKEKELVQLAVLIKAVSPVDGIIAEGMMGFVNRFIADMNTIIRHHWDDQLVIKPCKMDLGTVELDYMFAVETLYETPPDVSVCSKGQQEIINLAFREVAMKYMQLATHPILFDEWSVNMDDLHRQKACELLSTFTDVSMHNQIIVASHLKSVHDALGIVKRLVLSSKNITVNGEYNTHVKMSR